MNIFSLNAFKFINNEDVVDRSIHPVIRFENAAIAYLFPLCPNHYTHLIPGFKLQLHFSSSW